MIDTIQKVAIQLCEEIECMECPVYKQSFDVRTLEDKAFNQIACCVNLEHWIKETCLKERNTI